MRTSSLPGCASVQATTPSIAAPTASVLVRTIGVSMRAELVDLGGARELAEGVADEDRAGDLVLKEVAAVRKDRGHAGADGVALDRA